MKIREFPNKNYRAIFNEKTKKTLRIALDPTKPILPLDYPEILDISLGTKCLANCSYCYTDASTYGVNYSKVPQKVLKWFGSMTPNQRPFQVAIGGGGEPTLHPEFPQVLYNFATMGIVPNYTTNGMHLSKDILTATKNYCGGVALSYHPHIDHLLEGSAGQLLSYGIRTNLHIVIGQPGSVARFQKIYNGWQHHIDAFVLLPYQVMGRAENVDALIVYDEWTKLFDLILEYDYPKVAFGALFYNFIFAHKEKYAALDISLYEPETLSGYVMMDTEDLIIRKSSFDPAPKKKKK